MDLRKEYLQGWQKASVCPLSGLRANLENKMAWPFSGKVTLGSVPSMREGARGGRAYWAIQFSYNLFNSSTLYISTPKHFLILDFVLHSCISEQGWWLILTAYWPVMGRGTRLSASTPPTSIPTHNSPAPMKTTRVLRSGTKPGAISYLTTTDAPNPHPYSLSFPQHCQLHGSTPLKPLCNHT